MSKKAAAILAEEDLQNVPANLADSFDRFQSLTEPGIKRTPVFLLFDRQGKSVFFLLISNCAIWHEFC